MAGPRPGQRRVAGRPLELGRGVDRVGGHHLLPLGPLGVADLDRDRAALGLAVPDAADQGDLVLLELHPGAAAVAEPPARQGVADVVGGHPHVGGQPLEDRDERRAVRLTRRQPTQHGDPQSFQAIERGDDRLSEDDAHERPQQHERAERVALPVHPPQQGQQPADHAAQQEPAVDPDHQLRPAEEAQRDPEDAGQPDVAVPHPARVDEPQQQVEATGDRATRRAPAPGAQARPGRRPSSQLSSTVATVRTYVGAITQVGSSRVRQSTTASATEIGTSGSSTSSDHSQPMTSPTSAALTPAATAAFHARPGRAATAAYGSFGSSGTGSASSVGSGSSARLRLLGLGLGDPRDQPRHQQAAGQPDHPGHRGGDRVEVGHRRASSASSAARRIAPTGTSKRPVIAATWLTAWATQQVEPADHGPSGPLGGCGQRRRPGFVDHLEHQGDLGHRGQQVGRLRGGRDGRDQDVAGQRRVGHVGQRRAPRPTARSGARPPRAPSRRPGRGRGPRAWRAPCRARPAPAAPRWPWLPRRARRRRSSGASSCSPSTISAPVTSVLRPCREPSGSSEDRVAGPGGGHPLVVRAEQRDRLALERHGQRQPAPLAPGRGRRGTRPGRPRRPARRRTASPSGPARRTPRGG